MKLPFSSNPTSNHAKQLACLLSVMAMGAPYFAFAEDMSGLPISDTLVKRLSTPIRPSSASTRKLSLPSVESPLALRQTLKPYNQALVSRQVSDDSMQRGTYPSEVSAIDRSSKAVKPTEKWYQKIMRPPLEVVQGQETKEYLQNTIKQAPTQSGLRLSSKQVETLEEKLFPVANLSKTTHLSYIGDLKRGEPSSELPSPNTYKKKSTAPNGYSLQQVADEDRSPQSSKNPTTALKGGLTTLKVTKGRSQIIKFAQPIIRLSIAEPSLAELIPLSPDQILINGKQRGTTSLIVWDKNGQEGIFDLQVRNDSSELLDAVNAIAPNEKIEARVTDDSFVISGQVSSSVILDEIRKLAAAYGYKDTNFIDLTETPSPQVVLEVKIAEAGRSTIQDIKTAFSSDRGDIKTARFAGIPPTAVAAAPAPGAAAAAPAIRLLPSRIDGTQSFTAGEPIPATLPRSKAFTNEFFRQTSTNVGGIIGSFYGLSKYNLNTAFDFLETTGKLTTLANPTLVCTHGRTASFLAGGEFPFAQGTDQNGSPLITFKEFGVKLNFTPWIAIRSSRIELQVTPEVSSLDRSSCIVGAAGSQVCGLSKRATTTTVELKDGETLMLSGLISREEQNSFAAVPFINNIPILGALFKNSNMQKRETELILVVTPHIINAGSYGKVIADPG
ncbi:MAG: pilus assembly protein N-terminal domain-containing protein [Cyanobacteria bacterium]|nr:pilus assembly protein N-terminal domain-containing protein [Cyanobacteriota bacterium]